MFSVIKVRRGEQPGDYSDPGWFKHPPGTLSGEWTGALPDPARFKAEAGAAMPALAQPATATEVRVRKPLGGHSGH
jgi:hypothetical protein